MLVREYMVKALARESEQVRILRPVCSTECKHLSADFVTSIEMPAANAGGTTLICRFPVQIRAVPLPARQLNLVEQQTVFSTDRRRRRLGHKAG